MPIDPRIQDALNGPEPLTRLRDLVRTLQAQGSNQAEILALFEASRQDLREAGCDQEEDILLEVMDFLEGWCSPHMRLDPK
jgi:hypothetical protein